MIWTGYNFFNKNSKRFEVYAMLLNFMKNICESDKSSSFKISQNININDLNKSNSFCTLGMKKISRPVSINSIIDTIENTKKPNLLRDNTLMRIIPEITNLEKLYYHTFIFNNLKPYSNNLNFPYDPSYDRWAYLKKKYNLVIEDYKKPGSDILFILQLDTDQSLNYFNFGEKSYKSYAVEIIEKMMKITDRNIVIRSHPEYERQKRKDPITTHLKKILKDVNRVKFSDNKYLNDDLSSARCLVSYNSSAGIHALMKGINVINLDRNSPCLSAASNDLRDIEELKYFDRNDAFKKIAYLHWETKELTSSIDRAYLCSLLKKCALNLQLK